MTTPLVDSQRWRSIFRIVVVATVIGLVFGLTLGRGSVSSMMQGAFTGACISGVIAFVELRLLRSRAGEFIVESRFAVHFIAKTLFYLFVIIVVLLGADELFDGSLLDGGLTSRRFLVVAGINLLIALIFSFTATLGTLIGPGVLWKFLTGRYHTPRQEHRVFLFVDMIGSTRAAEELGPIRFHHLLRRFIFDVGDAAGATQGEIHKYVGDEAILTWPDAQARQGQPLDCIRHLSLRIAANAERYRREFGLVPEFRAAIHGGPIVAGELGGWKREIAYLGDVVNTTARIAEVCRSLDRKVLASREVLSTMEAVRAFRALPIGPVTLRGKAEPLELVALEPA